jgi:hypothetical protein
MKQEVLDKISKLIAELLVEHIRDVMTQHNINWDEQPLGKVSDKKLAKKLKVHYSTVCRHRQKKDIKPNKLKIDWDAQPLGKVPDSQIARQLKVSITAVRYQRVRRNIPTYSKPRRRKA